MTDPQPRDELAALLHEDATCPICKRKLEAGFCTTKSCSNAWKLPASATNPHDTREVTGCSGCPFNGDWWCNHTKPNRIIPSLEDSSFPDWCPLKSGPVLVRLKVGT